MNRIWYGGEDVADTPLKCLLGLGGKRMTTRQADAVNRGLFLNPRDKQVTLGQFNMLLNLHSHFKINVPWLEVWRTNSELGPTCANTNEVPFCAEYWSVTFCSSWVSLNMLLSVD